jgi:predicted RNA-binding protein with RPS1 domain
MPKRMSKPGMKKVSSKTIQFENVGSRRSRLSVRKARHAKAMPPPKTRKTPAKRSGQTDRTLERRLLSLVDQMLKRK